MKYFYSLFFSVLLVFMPLLANAATLPERLSGRILLQVQSNGEAWYVYPSNKLRYYLGRPADAFQIMRQLGRGISETDYNNFKATPPSRLYGWIMLRVQAHGEAYYVDPVSKSFVYLGRPADAFRIMREKGLGITNKNLSHMPVSGASIIPPDGAINIILDTPRWNDLITSPVAVTGQARVFENTLNLRLRNSNDKIIANALVTANSPDIGLYGPFASTLSFPPLGTDTGYLEAYTLSAKDGSEIDKVISLIRVNNNTTAWKTYTDSSGNSFLYPETFGTTYIKAFDWPPKLQIQNKVYSCTEGGSQTSQGGQTSEINVNGHTYCQTKLAEGAAGSVYTQYAYTFAKNNQTATLTFTTRMPQCGNYPEPQMTACQNEEASFDINQIVDRIAGSLLIK